MNLVVKFTDKLKKLFQRIGKKKLIVIFAIIILLFTLIILFTILSLGATKEVAKPKVKVTYGPQSTISVKTNELIIKEWNVKMPVNGNILGKVTYSMKNENTVIFSSSTLNQVDLTASECSGKTKDSWGVERSKDNFSDDPTVVYPKVGDYYIRTIGTSGNCEAVKNINAAFSYMVNYMSEQ